MAKKGLVEQELEYERERKARKARERIREKAEAAAGEKIQIIHFSVVSGAVTFCLLLFAGIKVALTIGGILAMVLVAKAFNAFVEPRLFDQWTKEERQKLEFAEQLERERQRLDRDTERLSEQVERLRSNTDRSRRD